MTALIKEYQEFIGDGSRDSNGNTLEEFLLSYDPYKYKSPSVTADIVVVKEVTTENTKLNNTGLQVLLIKRKNHPCIGAWALPGGFAEMEESLEESAKRELLEETGVEGIDVMQLHTWGDPDRDPRGRIITVSYLAYLEEEVEVKAGDDAKEAAFADIKVELMHTMHTETESVKTYELTLTNEEAGIFGEALVKVISAKSPRKNTRYELIENKGIAFDHAKILINALEYC